MDHTPAISVLSAIEGLEIAAPALKTFVVPLTVVVLVVLFAVQRKGTAGIGFVFGPIMLVWFSVLALAGVINVTRCRKCWRTEPADRCQFG
jgi:KUP system potassium uptake protein